ncbi:DUF4232 domain-containing protein [Streptomyces sp. HUCO-GS316]|uniref:DUF4232 domain-containing protein n=1 Tax=Streptomyces sp. HUCO-GS316 TaxID=2692198 RepID=UPI00136C4E1C|nr:DUF4232 domain-containing protein [Streptomyces sp. HUCO-GS316]MXM66307.1 DUF4232 domain-containing protein [Streptomyces sp. HUCO-GS316]
MRAIPVAVTALTAALLLTACGDGGDGGDGSAKSQDGTACTIDEVAVKVGPASAAPAAGDTGIVPVTITNSGSECTLDGMPAVALYAGGASTTVAPDEATKPRKLTLAKGGAVTFTLTYARGEAGGEKSLAVKTVKFSLPGAAQTHGFPWSYGEVALKSPGDPDASVSPFQQAGD